VPFLDSQIAHWIPDPDALPALREMSICDLLEEAVERWPERDALIYSYPEAQLDLRWSFAELGARVQEVAAALIACGVEHGERISVWATNVPHSLLLQLASAQIGAIYCPLNPLYRGAEVAHVLALAQPRCRFVEPVNRGVSLWDISLAATSGLAGLELHVALGTAPDGRGVSWETWLAAGRAVSAQEIQARRRRVTAQDIHQLQFTSGTTGFPKGVALRHGAFCNEVRLMNDRADLGEGPRVNMMPFFHTSGCIMGNLGCIAAGATNVPVLTFDPAKIVALIEAEQAHAIGAVPTMLIGLEEYLDASGADIPSLRRVVSGGSLVPVELARRWVERWQVGFSISYGLTENHPIITLSDPRDPVDLQVATCGIPLPHIEVDLVRPGSHERVAIDEEGELRTRGWATMSGYWGDPEATAEVLGSDGWLRTGDLGRMDRDGYFRVTGRSKEIIIRGGENISPTSAEEAMRTLDAVADVSVVGVPDERYGEESCAFVRLKPGVSLSVQEMREQLADSLARFKIPRHIVVVDEMPTTPSGKVQKFRLREQWIAAQRQDAPTAGPG
jgi:acyl-CoA synthetase (AMP-forming)/AMP-acid ligase II